MKKHQTALSRCSLTFGRGTGTRDEADCTDASLDAIKGTEPPRLYVRVMRLL